MTPESKIFVAGANGMVGSAIFQQLISSGYNNLVGSYYSHKPKPVYRQVNRLIQIDLRRQADVEQFFQKEQPEYVFLAAAKVGGILANSTYRADFIYDNIMISTNVIFAAYRQGAKKLLNLGSSCIYPKHAPQPLKETYLLTGELEPTNEPYSIAKIAAIKMCRYFNEQYNTQFISVMPTNLYGPNDNFNLETSHVLAALLRRFHLARLLEQSKYTEIMSDLRKFPIGFDFDTSLAQEQKFNDKIRLILKQLGITKTCVTLWGSGESLREFLYVEDLAKACTFLMKRIKKQDIGEFINIGTGMDMKIKELARTIKTIVQYGGEIRYDHSKPDGTPRKCLDISKMTNIGWQPQITLKDGLRRSYRWYLEQTTGTTEIS